MDGVKSEVLCRHLIIAAVAEMVWSIHLYPLASIILYIHVHVYIQIQLYIQLFMYLFVNVCKTD